jgi:hypothetical protein
LTVYVPAVPPLPLKIFVISAGARGTPFHSIAFGAECVVDGRGRDRSRFVLYFVARRRQPGVDAV